VEPELLELLLQEPYLSLPAPKSTGRELFNLAWLQRLVDRHTAAIADVQATLCEYTAVTIAAAITRLSAMNPEHLLVCGGGAFNGELMRRLTAQLPRAQVKSTAGAGIAPEQVEAAMCAWLAERHVSGRPGNLTAVTGARGPRVLGALYRGSVTQM
jgi:anhydro-N-acetylmuramic acid kinase